MYTTMAGQGQWDRNVEMWLDRQQCPLVIGKVLTQYVLKALGSAGWELPLPLQRKGTNL